MAVTRLDPQATADDHSVPEAMAQEAVSSPVTIRTRLQQPNSSRCQDVEPALNSCGKGSAVTYGVIALFVTFIGTDFSIWYKLAIVLILGSYASRSGVKAERARRGELERLHANLDILTDSFNVLAAELREDRRKELERAEKKEKQLTEKLEALKHESKNDNTAIASTHQALLKAQQKVRRARQRATLLMGGSVSGLHFETELATPPRRASIVPGAASPALSLRGQAEASAAVAAAGGAVVIDVNDAARGIPAENSVSPGGAPQGLFSSPAANYAVADAPAVAPSAKPAFSG